jgi:outer membrane protein assembly factor BamA
VLGKRFRLVRAAVVGYKAQPVRRVPRRDLVSEPPMPTAIRLSGVALLAMAVAAPAAAPPARLARVGQIFIIGNERTRHDVILRQVPLYPGQVLSYPDMKAAERNLERLHIFATTPRVTVVDNSADLDSPYKDILITVQEANTGSLLFGLGVSSDTGLTGSIVLNERNFDITKIPTSIDDFLNGSAFRGAGQEFRMEADPGTELLR